MENEHRSSGGVGFADPKISNVLMVATFAVGGIGYFVGFTKSGSGGPEAAVAPVALLSVGVVGILSMIRHSIFHRSDAIRMGWDHGRRNNFQLEVGFANLAIGLPALLAVTLGLNVMIQAAFVLAYALYFIQVTVLVLIDRTGGKVNLARLLVMIVQTGTLSYFALSAFASSWNQQAA